MAKTGYYNPFFKILSRSDSGEGPGHIAGILIPKAFRAYFPPILKAGPNTGVPVDARLVLPAGEEPAKLTFSRVRRGETRLTSGFSILRGKSRAGDIIVIERSKSAPPVYRVAILRQGQPDHKRAMKLAGSRRAGILDGWHYEEGPTFWNGGRGRAGAKYRYGALNEDRVLIARVTGVEALGDSGPHGRMSFELDGVDAGIPPDAFLRALSDEEMTAPFALTRVVSTSREIGFELTEGMWVEVVVSPSSRAPGPPAYVAQLTGGGYTNQARGVLGQIRILSKPGERPGDFRPVGAAVSAATRTATAIVRNTTLPQGAVTGGSHIAAFLTPLIEEVASIRVRDVGQASFVTLESPTGAELVHFDAGWPISYNGRTAPKNYPAASAAPVILSHWDWDHLHGFYGVKALQGSRWVAPYQQVGPGAARIAHLLHARKLLSIYRGGNLALGSSVLKRCSGHSGLNDTGLALDLFLQHGARTLLVGDASYQYAGFTAGSTFDMLLATHHGAAFAGNVPKPSFKEAPCIVSVGNNNTYGHPNDDALKAHEDAHWRVLRTCKHRQTRRGDRTVP